MWPKMLQEVVSCVSPAIAGTNVTDEQLDEMLESGQTDVFTQNVSAHAAKGGRWQKTRWEPQHGVVKFTKMYKTMRTNWRVMFGNDNMRRLSTHKISDMYTRMPHFLWCDSFFCFKQAAYMVCTSQNFSSSRDVDELSSSIFLQHNIAAFNLAEGWSMKWVTWSPWQPVQQR